MIETEVETATASPTTTEQLAELRAAWDALRQQQPTLRIRDAAHQLGVSEAELLATGCGHTVQRLQADWGEFLPKVESLGEVMALTRNAHAVHEKIGTYHDVSVNGGVGLVVDRNIDLRLFFRQWKYGFAVSEDGKGGPRRSLQFFDSYGQAVHKIYLRPDSNASAYDELVSQYRSQDQSGLIDVTPGSATVADLPDEEIDVAGLHAEWRAMEDTHQFYGMLRKYNVGRVQALRTAPPDLAHPMPVDTMHRALVMASQENLGIMVFVNSPGVVQIHSGPVERIVVTGDWVNVLDPGFNLHLRQSAIASAWVVRKPTVDGIVTSIEVFDEAGEAIAIMFGERKPGKPELEGWRAIVSQLEAETAAA